ncbi:hypothetical protein SLE2022_142350 [Rubroshorea leprosula]
MTRNKEDLEEEEDDIDDSLGKSSERNITRAKSSITNRTKNRGIVSQKNQPPKVTEQSQPQGTQWKPRGKTSNGNILCALLVLMGNKRGGVNGVVLS